MEDGSDKVSDMYSKTSNEDVEQEDEGEEEEEEYDGPMTYSFQGCGKCLGRLRDPVTTHCGHNFCLVCITNMGAQWRMQRTSPPTKLLCPVCHTSIRGMFNGPQESMSASVGVNHLLNAALAIIDQLIGPERAADTLVDLLVKRMGTTHEEARAQGAFADIVDKVSDLALTEADILRCKKDIADQQRILDTAIAMRTVVKDELRTCRLLEATVPSPYDRGMFANLGMCRRANAVFSTLPEHVYNTILVRTTPEMFSDAAKFAELMKLPIIGLAAASTVVIVECTGNNVRKVMGDLFNSPFWLADSASIIATWHEDNSPRVVKPAEVTVCHYFVAGTIGPAVCVLKEQHKHNKTLFARVPAITRDLPRTIYVNLAAYLGPTYTQRCVIGPTRTVQPGWDSIVPDMMK